MTEPIDDRLPLKPLTYGILLALEEREDYGYGLAKRIAEPEGGGIRLAPSNLYYVLDRLQAEGLIEESDHEDPEDRRRSYYRLTAMGREVFRAETSRLRAVLGAAEALGTGRSPS